MGNKLPKGSKLWYSLLFSLILSLSFLATPASAINLDKILSEVTKTVDVLDSALSGKGVSATAAKASDSSIWGKVFGGLENSYEKSAGESSHESLKKKPGFYNNRKMLDTFGKVARRLVPVLERQDLKYRFAILDTDEVNAFAVPGGYVYVTKGLMKQISSEDELAGVVAHELGHVNKRHGIRQAEKAGLMAVVVALMGAKDETEKFQKAAAVAAYFATMKFSRDDEFEADKMAVEYTYKAGYKPEGIISFFNKINKDSGLTKVTKYFSTHPPTNDRIERVKKQIAKVTGRPAQIVEESKPVYQPQPQPTPYPSDSGSNVPGIENTNGGRYTSSDLKAAYEEYAFTKAQYEYKVSQGAPVDEVMKAFRAYQAAKEKYYKIKQAVGK